MAEPKTLFDKAITKTKNNPILAIVIVFGTMNMLQGVSAYCRKSHR
jgi:hypothetical protein